MVALSILPLRCRIGRVVARSTRATTVTSSPSTRLDRSVSLPGSKYRRGTKSSRSPTVWMLRYLASGLANYRNIHPVGALLDFVPRRYFEPGKLTDLSSLVEGEDVTVVARVDRATTRPMRQR